MAETAVLKYRPDLLRTQLLNRLWWYDDHHPARQFAVDQFSRGEPGTQPLRLFLPPGSMAQPERWSTSTSGPVEHVVAVAGGFAAIRADGMYETFGRENAHVLSGELGPRFSAASSRGGIVVAASGSMCAIWMRPFAEEPRWMRCNFPVRGVAIDPLGVTIAAYGFGGEWCSWSSDESPFDHHVDGRLSGEVTSLDVLTDGRIFFGMAEGRVVTHAAQEVARHPSRVTFVRISPAQCWIASGDSDGVLVRTPVGDEGSSLSPLAFSSGLLDGVFHPDGLTLLVVLASGELLSVPFHENAAEPSALCVSADRPIQIAIDQTGRQLVVLGRSGATQLEAAAPVRSRAPEVPRFRSEVLLFAPDGDDKLLAVDRDSGTHRIERRTLCITPVLDRGSTASRAFLAGPDRYIEVLDEPGAMALVAHTLSDSAISSTRVWPRRRWRRDFKLLSGVWPTADGAHAVASEPDLSARSSTLILIDTASGAEVDTFRFEHGTVSFIVGSRSARRLIVRTTVTSAPPYLVEGFRRATSFPIDGGPFLGPHQASADIAIDRTGARCVVIDRARCARFAAGDLLDPNVYRVVATNARSCWLSADGVVVVTATVLNEISISVDGESVGACALAWTPTNATIDRERCQILLCGEGGVQVVSYRDPTTEESR